MKRVTALVAIVITVSCLLSGCDLWMSGEYLSVTPHGERTEQTGDVVTEVSSFNQLKKVLDINVSSCVDKLIVSVSSFNDATVDFYVQTAVNHILRDTPIGAYAVERIDYEIGTNRGEPVVAFNIRYRYSSTDILSIRQVYNVDEILDTALKALGEGENRIVLQTENYSEINIAQQVENYIMTHGDQIVEIPEFRISVYPERGTERIVDMAFDYSNEKQILEEKYNQLEKVLSEAEKQIKNQSQVLDIYQGFYSYLTQHASYTKEASTMPVYSLLCEQIGDSKAFAMTFAAMCRRAELDCFVVFGTYNSEHRYWNLVRFRGKYYHLDIIDCYNRDKFAVKSASDMIGYQWDAEKYPS